VPIQYNRAITFAFMAFCQIALIVSNNAFAGNPMKHGDPHSVFATYNKAVDSADWRTAFNCVAPEVRIDVLCEITLACYIRHRDQRVVALLRTFGLEEGAVETEYVKQYKAKHKIDLEAPGVVHVPPRDNEVFKSAIRTSIKDEAGFFSAASNLIVDVEWLPRYKGLADVHIEGCQATGKSTKEMYLLEGMPPNAPVKRQQHIPVAIQFVKVNGKWFITGEAVIEK